MTVYLAIGWLLLVATTFVWTLAMLLGEPFGVAFMTPVVLFGGWVLNDMASRSC